MFDAPYKFHSVNFPLKDRGNSSGNVHHYTFNGKKNSCYIVEAEEFDCNFFILGFYLEKDEKKNTNEKFGSKTYLYETSRVLATCLEIMKFLYQKNPESSFGFIGTPSVDDEKDLDLANTKRYRVYSQLMANVISPAKFQHYADTERSMYLLINRSLDEEMLVKLTEFLASRWNSLDN